MSTIVFRNTIFSLLFFFMPMTAAAQQTDNESRLTVNDSQTYKITYVDERKLFLKDNVVTLAAVTLEWPERISGTAVDSLQKWLCATLFGNDCQSLTQGRKQLYETLGEEITVMPEDPNIKRQYITLRLIEMGWDKDKYMSFRVMAQHRDGDEPKPKVNIQRLITYEVATEQILTTHELIRNRYMPNKLYHPEMCALIATNMPKVEAKIYSDDIPDQVCLLNKRSGVAFNLKNVPDDDGMDMLVEIPRGRMLEFFLTSKALKMLNGEVAKTKKVARPLPTPEKELMEDGQPVYVVTDSMPQYPDGMEKLSGFLMQQLTYPEFEKTNKIQGRVVISFVIGADGRICRPSVILPLSPGIDRAAVKAVLDMKPWIPGKMNGTPVNVRMAIPLVFRAN